MKRRMENIKNIYNIVVILLGAVIGAGFITGNEINQIFASNGYFAFLYSIVFLLSFSILSIIILLRAKRVEANTVEEVFLLNRNFKAYNLFIEYFLAFSMLIFCGIMLSALRVVAGIIGVIIADFLVILVCVFNGKSILTINKMILPIALIFLLSLGIVCDYDTFCITETFKPYSILLVFCYASLNLILCSSALFNFTNKCSKKEIITGCILSSVIISFLISFVSFVIVSNSASNYSVPIQFIAYNISFSYSIFHYIVLLTSIFTSLIICAYGLYKKVQIKFRNHKLIGLILVIFSSILSLINFDAIVLYSYIVIGGISFFLLLKLIIDRQ